MQTEVTVFDEIMFLWVKNANKTKTIILFHQSDSVCVNEICDFLTILKS